MVIQKIQVNCEGLRLCFINNNLFIFQPFKENLMYIYKMNNVSNELTKTKYIEVGFIFLPYYYIKSKDLLLSKRDKHINVMRMTGNEEFKVEAGNEFIVWKHQFQDP
ncbi:unnamed protein product [Paramecium octaurelia]|uniref:Uncharacterized protein n=1 Tax=Paramecium octaurelia TaxID=43137 RepID=A0A8S1YMP6_PAROT|nr:unnamed protein product [Paramecium octaurelia]